MTEFHADLHIHSKYSRATSRDLDLEHLAWWAARKGITVVGTGDCVHPAWLAELKDKLEPSGDGLFCLKPEIDAAVAKTLPPACRTPVRFMLSTEISTIYKKGERTRKIHHLVYLPDFAAADRLAASLARIGNIASDGRPILGLDSRNLLEVTLESGPDSFLVPAHIWTPWFAALGSQSGFDSIHECYGDLCNHVFAVETGLSSDPAMNWRVSSLDRYRLISNSDAHSPGKLGREATRFCCAPSFFAIRRALETGEGYGGTVEFFPEEGKYHLDGHRACGVRLDPAETIANEGRCPVCGNRVTVGVAHRVELLADREEAGLPPPTAGAVTNLVPLPEILSEIAGSGVGSQRVMQAYDRTTAALGADFTVLQQVPVEDIGRVDPLLGEAVGRLRAGIVIRQAGYDGEYGVIRLFADGELDRLTRGDPLFEAPVPRQVRVWNKYRSKSEGADAPDAAGVTEAMDAPGVADTPGAADASGAADDLGATDDLGAADASASAGAPGPTLAPAPSVPSPSCRSGVLAALDADQARAAAVVAGPLAVVAGPGSGKTRMLTHRLAHLVLECGVPAAACLAITFTRRAADELRERLSALLPADSDGCAVHTFHSLGLALLRADGAAAGLQPDFRIAGERERTAALAAEQGITEAKAARLLKAISLLKRTGAQPGDDATAAAAAACRRLATARNWVDFDDLVGLPIEILETDPAVAARWRDRFRHVCVDEFQDVDAQQYRLLQRLVAPGGNICVIGDPNQAIYGFRGADAACFERFGQDFPSARTVRLGRNYRSTGTIVTAAAQVIGAGTADDVTRPMQAPIAVHEASTEHAEAELVAATIERLLGGHDLLTANRERNAAPAGDGETGGGDAGADGGRPLGFGDFAVLYRTDAQSAALRAALDRAGIPFAKSSPAPIAGQAAVGALLDELARQDTDPRGADLRARIATAAEQLRRVQDQSAPDRQDQRVQDRRMRDDAEIAALSEAARWLAALAAHGDEALLREQVALSTEADFWDGRADRVSLLTMHAAKGLEFPVVFVVGLEDGLVPFRWSPAGDGANERGAGGTDADDSNADGNSAGDSSANSSSADSSSAGRRAADDEERRLFYVAMTRAKDRLFLSRAQQRVWRGQSRTLPPSPFLHDIAPALVRQITAPARRPRAETRQYDLF
ncbi:MAG: UvrD-helicase domain-containing protein [Lautropia sp.]